MMKRKMSDEEKTAYEKFICDFHTNEENQNKIKKLIIKENYDGVVHFSNQCAFIAGIQYSKSRKEIDFEKLAEMVKGCLALSIK